MRAIRVMCVYLNAAGAMHMWMARASIMSAAKFLLRPLRGVLFMHMWL